MSNMMSDVIGQKARSNEQDIERLRYFKKVLAGKEIMEIAVRLQALPSWAKDVESVYFYAASKHSPIDINVTLHKVDPFTGKVRDIVCPDCYHEWVGQATETDPDERERYNCPQCNRQVSKRGDQYREARVASTLPREIVKAGLATKLDKSKTYDGASIRIRGPLFPGRKWKLIQGATIEITGYVPQTCRLEWEEVLVPARTEKRAKIVCGPETPAEAQAAIANDTPLAPITLETIEAEGN